MLNGLYTATSGLAMQQKRMDTISSNLANLSTIGHKREVALFSEYLPNPTDHTNDIIRQSDYNKMINSTVRLDDIKVSFEQGYLKETGRDYDMALSTPNAFFTVDTPFGVRFSRNGEFLLNENRELITMDGYNVLSNMEAMQPVVIPEGSTITEDGTILLDGAPVGNIDIMQFDDLTALQKTGSNLYVAIDALPEPAENPGLTTGYLEGSNVNALTEMVKMIEAARGFETYSKVISSFEEMNSKAATEVGSVR
ncbi:MAG: flagellar biosynthesis protein FlgG [Denitrovibrio sp.]|nr:MAG: flagellar biosynthesis protein FlgG [Denitrovibrio sp.]